MFTGVLTLDPFPSEGELQHEVCRVSGLLFQVLPMKDGCCKMGRLAKCRRADDVVIFENAWLRQAIFLSFLVVLLCLRDHFLIFVQCFLDFVSGHWEVYCFWVVGRQKTPYRI